MTPIDWQPRSSVERRYSNAIGQIAQAVRFIVKRYATLEQIVAAISALTESPEWVEISRVESLRMVQGVSRESARTWREAAKRSRKGSEIYRLLRTELDGSQRFEEIIRENAELISSLPLDIARRVNAYSATRAVAGLRYEDQIKAIKAAAPEISTTRARLLARTETAKAQATITQVRAEALDLDWYVWRTSEDQRVRSSHEHMEGVLCRYSEPPSPEMLIGEKHVDHYHPGGIFNCRCYAEPVIDLDFLTFPLKVHYSGRIVRMGRSQFLKVA